MFSDVSSLWTSAGSAIQNIGENISNALENLEENLEDQENSQLSELEIYKKLFDDAKMQHFQLSTQFRVLVSEKESEIKIWKRKYIALSGEEEVVEDRNENGEGEGVMKKPPQTQSDDLSTLSADDKELLLVKTLAEVQVLKTCMQEVEGQLKSSLHEKNESAVSQKKNISLEKEIKELRNRFKENNDISSSDIQNKAQEIDDLVSEYSKLASESEHQKSSDSQRIREVELENEMLTMRMQALEHSLTELADRSTDTSNSSSSSGGGNSTSSSSSSESPGSGSGSGMELKDLKARLVHLEYDIKSKNSTITELRAQKLQPASGSGSESPSLSSSSEDMQTQTLQLNLTKRMEEIANLQQDVSRLQIEKKEAESAGKSFYEQFKDLQKSSKANESSLLEEFEQDLSTAQSECTKSREEAESLMTQVVELQAELERQQSSTSAVSEETQQSLAEVQTALSSSTAEVGQLQTQLQDRDKQLADLQKSQLEAAEVSNSLNTEKDILLQKTQGEVSQLQQELELQKNTTASQQEEWSRKLELAASASTSSTSSAVAEVTQTLSLQLEQQAQSHMGVLAEQRQARDQEVKQAEQETKTLQAQVESLESELVKCRGEISSKEEQERLDKEAHEAALQQQEAQWRETAETQASTQVAAALAEAKETASKSLQSSLAEQNSTIREECQDHETAALKTLSDQLTTEHASALESLEQLHQQALTDLTQQLHSAQEAALVEQETRLASTHAAEKAALEALRTQDQEAAKQAAATAVTAHQAEVATLISAKESLQQELFNVEETNRLKTEAAIAAFRVESEEKMTQAVAAIRHEMQSMVDTAEAAREEYLQLYTKESKARKAVHNKLMEIQGNIRVVCRVRPILEVERKQAKGADVDATEILSEEDIVVHRDASTKNRFEFDRVFPPGGTQEAVFASVQPLIVSVLDGFNVCIFAYGQTGSGKTFTMEGYGDAPENKGVSPRAIDDLFTFIGNATENWAYVVKFSMLEIYNETIRDLLVEPAGGGGKATEVVKLDIRQTATGNVVSGLTEVVVAQSVEVLDLMGRGQRNRAVGAHDMNEHSSRSHSILTLTARGVNNKDGSTTCGKLHLIDLAGSERVGKTDATGDRLKEAQNINRSLSALGDVINSLGSKKSSHVPYRNSKLTFLLQDSLGGNSKVLMFVNVSPAVYNVNESICSLNFAFRCRNVELGQAKKQVGNGSSGSSGSSGSATPSASTPSKASSSGSSSSSSSGTMRRSVVGASTSKK